MTIEYIYTCVYIHICIYTVDPWHRPCTVKNQPITFDFPPNLTANSLLLTWSLTDNISSWSIKFYSTNAYLGHLPWHRGPVNKDKGVGGRGNHTSAWAHFPCCLATHHVPCQPSRSAHRLWPTLFSLLKPLSGPTLPALRTALYCRPRRAFRSSHLASCSQTSRPTSVFTWAHEPPLWSPSLPL